MAVHVAVQTGRAFDLVKGVHRVVALVQEVQEVVYQEREVLFRWGQENLDQGVKVGRDL